MAITQRPQQAVTETDRAPASVDFVDVTVRRILELDEVRAGDPRVLNGETGLDNRVRWVHVSELPDIGQLLRGGELILTTGIALPHDDTALDTYIDDLAEAEVSGLVIELGRRFGAVPERLSRRAAHHGLALIALQREARFVRITEQVHESILDQQLEVLRASERIHRTFTQLNTDGATATQIVSHVAQLAGAPVFLENVAHQVLTYSPDDPSLESVLADWERISRRASKRARTEVVRPDDDAVWVITDVAARGEHWGRLLLRLDGEPTSLQIGALERGSTALALNQLADRDRETLERQSHRTLINDIYGGTFSSSASVTLQAHNLGVPLTGRALVGVIVSMAMDEDAALLDHEARGRNYAGLVADAAHRAEVPALVGVLRAGLIGAVLSLDSRTEPSGPIDAFARAVHRAVRQFTPAPTTRIGRGSIVGNARDLRRSLVEAEQVVAASASLADDKLCFAMPDIRIHGLLYLLRDDPRVQLFIERELSTLLAHDETHGTALTHALEVFLDCSGNKSLAASELGISRPALYQRLQQIERVLGVSLESSVSRVSLQVALLALGIVRTARPGKQSTRP